MSVSFEINAEVREDDGRSASRRLRRSGRVPGIIYGGGKEPQAISVGQNELFHSLENEAFYSHILTVNVGGKKEKAILRDLQRHPYKAILLHFDLMRVTAGTEIKVNVPLHFVGEEKSPGVKAGGVMSHQLVEVEINVLPKNLPEYIEVDVSELDLGDSIHLSEITLPTGVSIPLLAQEGDHNLQVVGVQAPTVVKEESEDDEAAGEGEADAGSEADKD